ncbi:MAG: signal peptidase I [Chlamydiales bacterium]|jgi:signal peptidase I
MTSPFYRLSSSKSILRQIFSLYKSKWKYLSQDQLENVELDLSCLDKAILDKDREEADRLAHKLEIFAGEHFQKTPFDHCKEILIALVAALLIATLVRQVWFEPMEIPTGSMRPTFKEQDRLIVPKDSFGLNVPLKAKNLYFDSSLIQRTDIFIFRPENMDMQGTDTTYFGIPGKKRYIKRCMGKPGDTLYFYGGRIYGFDRDGNDLKELRESPYIQKLEHIPFINFEGKVVATAPNSKGLYSPVFYYQMNQLIGKHSLLSNRKIRGEIFINKQWKEEKPHFNSKNNINSYSDFWGMKNFGMARILTKHELEAYSTAWLDDLEDAPMYLEIRHTPNLTVPASKITIDKMGRIRPTISTNSTVIPLHQHHLDAIMDNMYTSRMDVKNEFAHRYSVNFNSDLDARIFPLLPGIEDGRYEFYYGKAYSITWGGISNKLPSYHPLNRRSPEHIQKLFNLGIELLKPYEAYQKGQPYYPSRYVFFRDGDLFLMGSSIYNSDDPTLVAFREKELKRQSLDPQYSPFLDNGAPLKDDGSLDIEFVRTFGFHIPEKMYLALGDNHASSSDSRDFGFVPEENIRGTAGRILWPPGDRWGVVPQYDNPLFNKPRLIIWTLVSLLLGACLLYYIAQKDKPIFKKLSPYPEL